MAGLNEILGYIESSTKDECDRILSSARAEADSVLESARQKAADITAKAERMAKGAIQNGQSAADAYAKSACARELLAKKQQLVDRVVSDAAAQILAMDDKQYFEFISTLLSEFKGIKADIAFCERDLGRLPAGLLAEYPGLRLNLEAVDIDGGFIVTCGDIIYDMSIAALFEARREKLCDAAAAVLFE